MKKILAIVIVIIAIVVIDEKPWREDEIDSPSIMSGEYCSNEDYTYPTYTDSYSGSSYTNYYSSGYTNSSSTENSLCSRCKGCGYILCSSCDGTGYIQTKKYSINLGAGSNSYYEKRRCGCDDGKYSCILCGGDGRY